MTPTNNWTETEWSKFDTWLKSMLQAGPATVTFIKKDGTERVMKCTLDPAQYPVVEVAPLVEGKAPRKVSTTSMRVFDLEKKEWRSFTTKSVTRVELTI